MIVSVRFSVCFADINHFDGALIISRVSHHQRLVSLAPVKYRREDLELGFGNIEYYAVAWSVWSGNNIRR